MTYICMNFIIGITITGREKLWQFWINLLAFKILSLMYYLSVINGVFTSLICLLQEIQ